MFQSHAKDVLVVETVVLHRLDEFAGLITRHGSCLFKDALEGSADVRCHGDVTTDVEVTSLLNELVDNLVCVLFQQMLDVGLSRGGGERRSQANQVSMLSTSVSATYVSKT